MKSQPSSSDYAAFLAGLKSRIGAARLGAARAVNRELIALYWDIGSGIVEKQRMLGWGESVVERLAADLRKAFPEIRGFSPRTLRDAKRFYLAYAGGPIWPQAAAKLPLHSEKAEIRPQTVAKIRTPGLSPEPMPCLLGEIPWGHHRLILDKFSDPNARIYYLQATAGLGWSRNVLLNQIKAEAYERAKAKKKAHNFQLALPENLAEQANEMLKSSYNLEFLGIGRAVKERELEDRLLDRLRDFILELGYGFCFVGRQHRLVLGRKEYFVDLLFYHRFLKALVAIELKVGPFEPEFAGKMDFYLNLLNEKERAPGDAPSIGIILCAEKDDIEVEFALRTKANPIGVAEYQLQPRLPSELKGKLPTAKQLADAVRDTLP